MSEAEAELIRKAERFSFGVERIVNIAHERHSVIRWCWHRTYSEHEP